MFSSSERPNASHCAVFRLLIFILTAVIPLVYVQLIFIPTSLVSEAVVVGIVVTLDELLDTTIAVYRI